VYFPGSDCPTENDVYPVRAFHTIKPRLKKLTFYLRAKEAITEAL
jgi:hypothetical protein